jgi:hypothetical protein
MPTEVQIYKNGTVVAEDLADKTITAAKIADKTITAAQIADTTITAAKIADKTIAAAQIVDTTITAAQIADKTITAAQIADETITAAKLSPLINFFPAGGIIMWSGTIAAAQALTGWKLCDGTNGTPDLRNRFIVGAHSGAGNGTVATAGPGFDATPGGGGALSANYTPGNTGGKTAHKLTIAELASHNHNITLPLGRKWDLQGNDLDVPNFTPTQYTSDPTGGDNYHENRPPYYALAFIMKT